MISINYLFESKTENNIIQMFENIKHIIKTTFNYNVDYMKLIIYNGCVYNNNEKAKSMNQLSCAGNWTHNHIIYIGSTEHLKKVMKFYNVDMNINVFIMYIISHELGHEIFNNILSEDDKVFYANMLKDFDNKYLNTVKSYKLNEERFCEYIATKIVSENI